MNQQLEDVIKVRQGVKFGGAGKIEEMLTRPQFSLPRTAVLVLKIALCSKVLDFPRTSVITSLDREYRQQ